MPAVPAELTARVVLDESSIRLDGLTADVIEGAFEGLSDLLDHFLPRPGGVLRSDLLYEYPCRDDADLSTVLYGRAPSLPAPGLDRDVRLRLARLLDRCSPWDELWSDLPRSIRVAGVESELALSVSFAATMGRRGHHIACLAFDLSPHRGFIAVELDGQPAEVFFLAAHHAYPHFLRELFRRENVDEAGFFALAGSAFEQLVLAPDLTFRRFEGSYRDLRDRVVQILAALNDHFPQALIEGKGVAEEVAARVGRYGLDVSPEGPKTRGSKSLMAGRRVMVGDDEYDCGWHAKLERHRNRIHFALPDERIGGRMLIGVFVRHLET